MTGYGRGECARNGFKVTVEVSSVNRRQSEISVNLPRDLEPLEAQIRDEINRVISRGRITARVALHAAGGKLADQARVNKTLAEAYAKEFRKLAKSLKLSGELSLDALLRSPGVLETDEDRGDAEDFWPAVHKSLTQALAALLKMREREGAHLAKDLRNRMKIISDAVARIHSHAPEVQKRYREQLIERIKAAGISAPAIDDERLIKEVVYFADRSDISEELTRLESHFEVVTVKAELEKFREQVQNVE
ncbi:MAG: DUF1732 domain-containing protein [Verrucomicrobia bacterium]|nr:DUF1732 domain-containing protein [Verrucomicrobiota bacterium]